jgi:hypothetical protein
MAASDRNWIVTCWTIFAEKMIPSLLRLGVFVELDDCEKAENTIFKKIAVCGTMLLRCAVTKV